MDFQVDVREILEMFRDEWLTHPDFSTNPTAFTWVREQSLAVNCNCPFHHENKPAFGMFTEHPYSSHCFVCKEAWGFFDVYAHVYQIDAFEAYEHFESELLQLDKGRLYDEIDVAALFEKPKLPSMTVFESDVSKYKAMVNQTDYWRRKRGFTEEVIGTFDLGFDPVTHEVVVPIRSHEGTLSFIQRIGTLNKRFDNGKGTLKDDVFFGLDKVIDKWGQGEQLKVIVTESATDAMALHVLGLPGISTNTSSLSEAQVKVLKSLGCASVIMFYDNDFAGMIGTKKAIKMLEKYNFNVSIMQPTPRFGIDTLRDELVTAKDANDLIRKSKGNQVKIISSFEYLMCLRK